MGNNQSINCQTCSKHIARFQRGTNCVVCLRNFCTNCSNREKVEVENIPKLKRVRICHTCQLSIHEDAGIGQRDPLKQSQIRFQSLDLTTKFAFPKSYKQKMKNRLTSDDHISAKLNNLSMSEVHISEPQKAEKTINVKFNHESQKFEGLPKMWRELLNMEPQEKEITDFDKTLIKRVIQIKPKDERSKSFLITQTGQSKQELKFEKQEYDVELDENNQNGFKGLPQSLEKKLQESNFSKEQIKLNPVQVLEAINFTNNGGFDSKQEPLPLPSNYDYMQLITSSSLFKEDNPASHYDIVKQIGAGGYGKIYLCSRKSDRQQYALKFILKNKMQEQTDAIKNEIVLMSICKHKNIVRYEDGFYFKDRFWIFMEYMDAGCLTDLLEAGYFKAMTEEIISYLVFETLQALKYLHDKHIIHRDIKSDNILLSMNGDIKLADFGYAAQLTRERKQRKSKVGTVCWMAPEIIRAAEQYTEKVDIWSLGIMILEFIFGEPPYLNQPQAKVCYLILTVNPPEIDPQKWSQNLRDFLKVCLTKNPHERPSVDDLLQHPFIKNRKAQVGKNNFMQLLKKYADSSQIESLFSHSESTI